VPGRRSWGLHSEFREWWPGKVAMVRDLGPAAPEVWKVGWTIGVRHGSAGSLVYAQAVVDVDQNILADFVVRKTGREADLGL
jgi:hypothetical protein